MTQTEEIARVEKVVMDDLNDWELKFGDRQAVLLVVGRETPIVHRIREPGRASCRLYTDGLTRLPEDMVVVLWEGEKLLRYRDGIVRVEFCDLCTCKRKRNRRRA